MIKEYNETDELIFDYLEGNLTNKEKEAFELLLSGDESLQAEVMMWKKTFVTEPFTSTKHLEQALLQSSRKPWRILSLNTFIVSIFLVIIPASIKEEMPLAVKQDREADTFIGEELLQSIVNPATAEPVMVPIVNSEKETATLVAPNGDAVEHESLTDDFEVLIIQKPVRFPVQLQINAQIKEINKSMVVRSSKKQLTRKDVRQLNRKKRKELQKKEADEFRKGNVPYVVPLNQTNF